MEIEHRATMWRGDRRRRGRSAATAAVLVMAKRRNIKQQELRQWKEKRPPTHGQPVDIVYGGQRGQLVTRSPPCQSLSRLPFLLPCDLRVTQSDFAFECLSGSLTD